MKIGTLYWTPYPAGLSKADFRVYIQQERSHEEAGRRDPH